MPRPPTSHWRLALGAESCAEGVRFRVWAPKRHRVEVLIENGLAVSLSPEAGGYFSGLVPEAAAGTLYRYRLDGEGRFPDPCARFQPEGPHGPSMVVDPAAYKWHDEDWLGITMAGQVIYELHVGTLEKLKQLGVTVIEVMPVAEFPGTRNWGYDGVNLYAPTHVYGDPEALKRFVDAAHG